MFKVIHKDYLVQGPLCKLAALIMPCIHILASVQDHTLGLQLLN